MGLGAAPAYGGTENVLDALARRLEHAGHDVSRCTTGDSTCPEPKAARFERAVGNAAASSGLLELRHVIAVYESAAGYIVVHGPDEYYQALAVPRLVERGRARRPVRLPSPGAAGSVRNGRAGRARALFSR